MSALWAVGEAEMRRSPVVRGARGGNSARGARANPYRNEQCDRSKGRTSDDCQWQKFRQR